jgi:hypothetical protein
MKIIERIWAVSVAASLLALGAGNTGAATYTSKTSGDWTSAATWNTNAIPGNGDPVNVYSNCTVTLNNATNTGSSGALTIGGTTTAQGAGKLVVAGSGLLNLGSATFSMYQNSALVITNGGSVTTNVTGIILNIDGASSGQNNSYVLVAGQDSKLTLAIIYICRATSTNNYMVVSNGASVTVSATTGLNVGYGANSFGSYLLVGKDGTVTATVNIANSSGAMSNYVMIADGGQLINPSNTRIGQGAGANANSVVVTGTGSVWNTSGTVYPGAVVSAYNNSIVVSNGGLWAASASGPTIAGTNNYILIDGGTATNGLYMQVGIAANDFGNYVLVRNGGLLQVPRIDVGKNADASSMSNTVRIADGGVLQFLATTPAINLYNTGSTGNEIVMTNATLSYRGVRAGSTVNLLGQNKGATYEGKFTWLGANTFRLNDSSVSNTTTYTFEATADPKNYVGLEMVEGTTYLAANPVTVGPTGKLLLSNTTATVSGACTMNGTMTIRDSTATFSGGLTNGGLLTGSGVISGLVTVAASGTLSAGGAGATGTLTFSTNVTFNGGTNLWTYTGSACDTIQILGKISGSGVIKVDSTGPLPASAVAFTLEGQEGTPTFTTTEGYGLTVTSSNITVRAASRGYLMIIQ